MAQAAQLPIISHYTAYKPRPFTREERDTTTILYGGLTWKHERLMQGVLHNLKYNAEPLPNIARQDLDAGKELIDVGACCPTIFTTGSLVNFLKKEVQEHGRDEVNRKYVYLTAGACGPCRFGQYHESYAMALDGLGLRDFRLFLLAQDELDQESGNGGGLLDNFTAKARQQSRDILAWCAKNQKPCILVLARPYHMDTGIGHEIEGDLQAHGYPILWLQYLPGDEDLMNWLFEADLQMGRIKSPFDISDVWTSSYSSNTNEIMWGAKVAARCPWITCDSPLQLRVRHGPADLHPHAENCGGDRNPVLQVWGLGFDEARGRHQDPHRDHRSLPGKVLTKDHAAKVGVVVAELPARPSSSLPTARGDSGGSRGVASTVSSHL